MYRLLLKYGKIVLCIIKMQCSNSWFYGQKGVSRINVILLKIFCKRFNKDRNTQVNEKEKKKKIKYE